MLLTTSLALIATGAGLCAIEDLISFRRTKVILQYGRLRRVCAVALGYFIIGAALFAGVAFARGDESTSFVALAMTILAFGLLGRALTVQTLDGSDRMLLFAATAAASWLAFQTAHDALANIARIGLLVLVAVAYFESGWVKLKNPGWRTGRQLALVLN